MNQPLVSIGIPAFKGVHFAEALRSIKNQTYRNIEVIVQDDASPDDLESIFDAEVGDDSRFSYARNKENSSPDFVKNWDIVLQKAKGEYFVLASDDDVYEPTFLEKVLSLADKYPAVDIFSCLYDRFNGDGVIGLVAKPAEYESQTECMYAMVIENRYPIAPNVMVRTQGLRSMGGFVHLPAATASDYLTWLKLAKNGFVTCPEYLLHWRYDGTNVTSSKSNYWDRQKYIAAKQALPIWTGLCESLGPISPQEKFQKKVLKQFFEEHYDHWMTARFMRGMTTKEYIRYWTQERRVGHLSGIGWCRIVFRRLLQIG